MALPLAETAVELCPFKGMWHSKPSLNQAVFSIDLEYTAAEAEWPECGDQGVNDESFRYEGCDR